MSKLNWIFKVIPVSDNQKGNFHSGSQILGTCFLVYAALTSGGDGAAVGLTLMVLIMCTGPITGAHYNPAVAIGVYVW